MSIRAGISLSEGGHAEPLLVGDSSPGAEGQLLQGMAAETLQLGHRKACPRGFEQRHDILRSWVKPFCEHESHIGHDCCCAAFVAGEAGPALSARHLIIRTGRSALAVAVREAVGMNSESSPRTDPGPSVARIRPCFRISTLPSRIAATPSAGSPSSKRIVPAAAADIVISRRSWSASSSTTSRNGQTFRICACRSALMRLLRGGSMPSAGWTDSMVTRARRFTAPAAALIRIISRRPGVTPADLLPAAGRVPSLTRVTARRQAAPHTQIPLVPSHPRVSNRVGDVASRTSG